MAHLSKQLMCYICILVAQRQNLIAKKAHSSSQEWVQASRTFHFHVGDGSHHFLAQLQAAIVLASAYGNTNVGSVYAVAARAYTKKP